MDSRVIPGCLRETLKEARWRVPWELRAYPLVSKSCYDPDSADAA